MSESAKVAAIEVKEIRPADANAGLLQRLRGLFGIEPASVRGDIEDAIEETGAEAEFSPHERTILKNVLGLHDVRISDVMVPRADVVAVSVDVPLDQLLTAFRKAAHSRLPVYEDTLDDPKGMVHIRDLMEFLAGEPRFGLIVGTAVPVGGDWLGMKMPLAQAKILRPVLYTPPSTPALDLLVRMQTTRTHMALVIDEYGGTDGLVSIEDLVEAIVGDIEDEHDESEAPGVRAAGDGVFLVEARADLKDVSREIRLDLMGLGEAEDVDTIGGLVTAKIGRVPGRGEVISAIDGLEIEVLDADPRRIKRLKIAVAKKATSDDVRPGPDSR